MGWYSKPTDSNYKDFNEGASSAKELWKYEFSLKSGESRTGVFLADEQITVYTHTVPVAQKYFTFVCSRNSDCYGCGTGVYAKRQVWSSFLDLTPYTMKDGTQKKYSKRGLAASGQAIDVLNRRRMENGGDLTGYKVVITRDGEKSPKCGNDFQLKEKVDLTKLTADVAKPFDWEKILEPLPTSVVEARIRFGGAQVATQKREVVQGQQGTANAGEDDIPF